MANTKSKVTDFHIYEGVDQDEQGNTNFYTYNVQVAVESKNRKKFDKRKVWDKIEELLNSSDVEDK